jgi:hypothetical protein
MDYKNDKLKSYTDKVKCCKPKCKAPAKNVCDARSFYDQFTTGTNLFLLNVIVIIARFKELNFAKFKSLELFWFLVWLEIQIVFFYYGLLFFYWTFNSLKIILLIIKSCADTISKPLSKKKGFIGFFIKSWEVMLKIFLVFVVILLIQVCVGLVILFFTYLIVFGPILLGYTKFF